MADVCSNIKCMLEYFKYVKYVRSATLNFVQKYIVCYKTYYRSNTSVEL